MDRGGYKRGYSDCLEHIEAIFNRLFLKGKIREGCKECSLIPEIEKMRLLIKGEQFDQIERELGYLL